MYDTNSKKRIYQVSPEKLILLRPVPTRKGGKKEHFTQKAMYSQVQLLDGQKKKKSISVSSCSATLSFHILALCLHFLLLDIDECLAEISDCEQYCINTVGAYECFCQQGFRLNEDRRSCVCE